MAKTIRKQLKEDKFLSSTAKLSIFLGEHWKQISIIIAAVIVLIGMIVLYSAYITGRNERAGRSFNEARILFDEAVAASATSQESKSATEKYEAAKAKFQELSQKSGNADTISMALFYSAKCSYELGEYDEALSAFRKFAGEYPKSVLAPHVQRVIGYCYEQLGGDENLKKAIQQYDKVLKAPETDFTLEAFVDKGRCYEKLGDWEKAVSSYNSITDKFKKNVEIAIQTKSRELTNDARGVISKYEAVLGSRAVSDDFTKYINEANGLEKKEQWFEALKAYDKAIFAQKRSWSENMSKDYSRSAQNALSALKTYEDTATDVIENIIQGKRLEKEGDWDGALRYYERAVDFDFLPGKELFDRAQFRILWINSIDKQG